MIKRALAFQQQLTGESLFYTARRYFIFIAGGAVGWLIVIGLHTLFRDSYNVLPIFSYAIGLFFADLFTFVYHHFVTFRGTEGRWHRRFLQFSLLVVAISIANWFFFFIARGILDLPLPDVIISFVITGFLSAVNFLVNRMLIFRKK
jgi:putative flippase GtrA